MGHPEEAAQICHEQRASWVNHNEELPLDTLEDGTESGNGIVLLTFSRHPARLTDSLLSSPPAQTAVSRGVELQPAWANGGKVFVEGVSAELFDEELSAYQVVIREEDEPAIWASLEHLPYNVRKLKPGVGWSCPPGRFTQFDISSCATSHASDTEDVIEVTVKNTFIHVGPAQPDDKRSVLTV